MTGSTARLSLAPDDPSRVGGRRQQNGPTPPAGNRDRCGAGAAGSRPGLLRLANTQLNEGVDMQQSTREPSRSDRWTSDSGVNITPPTHAGPVPTTHTAR